MISVPDPQDPITQEGRDYVIASHEFYVWMSEITNALNELKEKVDAEHP